MELIPPIALNRHRVTSTHEHVTLVYFATAKSDVILLSETEKTSDCRWFAEDQLANADLDPHILHFAKLALETLGNRR